MTRFLNSATCNVYENIYQSIPDSPYAHSIADRMCKQDRKQAEHQKIVDRADRRHELSLSDRRLKALKEQVAADMTEEREEEVRSHGNP